MNDAYQHYLERELPARYEFVTIYGKTMKMDGIYREEITLDEKNNFIFWIWTPILPDKWLVWFQSKYISEIIRTPVALYGEHMNLYKPQMKIYHPNFEFKKIDNKIMEIKITEGSLWNDRKR